jgi:hypothetical protein
MSKSCRSSGRRAGRAAQRGDILLESLIGVLLTGFLGAGIAHVASRISVGQYEAKLENAALEQMRGRLQREGVKLCQTEQMTIAIGVSARASVSVSCKPAQSLDIGIGSMRKTVQAPREISIAASVTSDVKVELGTRQLPAGTP